MKTAKGLIAVVTLMAGVWVVSSTAWAGSKQQHRWEGVAIGLGAAIAGHALIGHHANGPFVCSTANAFHRYRNTHHRHPKRSHGHWQCRRPWHDKPYWHQPRYHKHHYRKHHRSGHGPGRHYYQQHLRHGHHRGGDHHRGRHGGHGHPNRPLKGRPL